MESQHEAHNFELACLRGSARRNPARSLVGKQAALKHKSRQPEAAPGWTQNYLSDLVRSPAFLLAGSPGIGMALHKLKRP